ncbi:MAG: hypothetical protein H0Z33_08300 [Bacillaceae bacterium]|nr:hypothetical protein [Bacillaceae bacterium]
MWGLLFLSIALVAGVFSFYYSARSRKMTDENEKQVVRAKMNVSMGIMLMALATNLLGVNQTDSVRFVVGAVFGMLGAANLFLGMRNYRVFREKLEDVRK